MNLAWIPNSITMGNLLFGFLSIVFASNEQLGMAGFTNYTLAGLYIIFAAFLDGCDGQVARMLKVSSTLGAELDSLADCVTFGVAPGYLVYSAYLSDLKIVFNEGYIIIGIFIAAVFPICAAYRLARFNTKHKADSFSGLPSPVAGISVALTVMTFDRSFVSANLFVFVPLFVLVALLMVSTLKFSKVQIQLFKRIQGIKLILLILLLLLIMFLFRKWILFIMLGFLGLYIISGLTSFVIQYMQENKY